MPSFRSLGVGFLSLVLVSVVGCHGDASDGGGTGDGKAAVGQATISAEDGGIVISEDAQLVLDVPPGALAEDTEIGIRAVPIGELPDEVKPLAQGGDVAYELSPDGLKFEHPVFVMERISDVDAPKSAQLLSYSSEVGVEPVGLTGVTRLGGMPAAPEGAEPGLWAVGFVRHFSWVVRQTGDATISVELPDELKVGEPATVQVVVDLGDTDVVGRPNVELFPGTGGRVTGLNPTTNVIDGKIVVEREIVCTKPGHAEVWLAADYNVRSTGDEKLISTPAGYGAGIFEQDGVLYRKDSAGSPFLLGGFSYEFEVPCSGEGEDNPQACCYEHSCKPEPCQDITATPIDECTFDTCPPTDEAGACCTEDGMCSAASDPTACVGNYYPRESCKDFECPHGAIDPLGEDAKKLGWVFPDDAGCTELSDGKSCEDPEAPQRVEGVLDPIVNLSQAAATRLFDGPYACDGSDVATTVCAANASSDAGEYVVLATQFGAEIPVQGDRYLQYAFVFDSDGITTNNWVPLPAYPKDFFAGTDLWYEALYDPGSGWQLRVRDVRQDMADVPSAARIVFSGRQMAIFVPRSELDIPNPGYRTSAFSHEGDYGLQGGAWSGDYYPNLESSLMPVADFDVSIDQ